MNKLAMKTISLGTCVALGVGGMCAAFAQTNEKEIDKTAVTSQTTSTATTEGSSKDETVYVLASADGEVNKIIVSDWISNSNGSESISDESSLSDIENVKGDETYSVDSDGMLVWDAQGNDIYYQGNSTDELPVGMTVSYKLDGKSVTADEIAGKSGKVTIRFDYENREYETVLINGSSTKIYVPFAMLTGLILDNDNFTNVEVSNGKLINDGDRTIVAGLAFPGLQQNLNISKSKLEIPDYIEITADAENFELGTTVTVATNEIFNEIDTSKLSSADGELDSLSQLSTAMTQLIDGSSALYSGLSTLLEKSDELVSGVEQLASGAKTLKDGAASLDSGAATLKKGVEDLSSGLNTLSSSSSELNSGAEQVFNTLLSTAATQIRAAGIEISDLTIANYADVLNAVIASLDDTTVYNQALAQVTEAVEAKRGDITTAVTAEVKNQVTEEVTAEVQSNVTAEVTAAVRNTVAEQVISSSLNKTKADYDAEVTAGKITAEQQSAVETAINEQMAQSTVTENINTQVSAKMQSTDVQNTISQNVETQMQSEKVQNIISQNVEIQVQKAISENMSSTEVQAKLTAASEGAKSVIALKSSLDSYNTFYLGLKKYTAGVDSAASGAGQLKDGAASLKDGTSTLKDGAATLYDGILTLQNGMPALVDGTTQLRDGSMTLSDGLKQFDEQGVQKIVDLVDGDIEGLLTRLKATVDVSNDYCNFSGLADGMNGQVKFIYRTDEIKATTSESTESAESAN